MDTLGGHGVDSGVSGPAGAGRRRMAAYYAALILVTTGVLAFVIATGTGEKAQHPIAGGYDVAAGTVCLGPKIDLAQSGRFVTLSNAQSTVSGELTFRGTLLTGTVSCVNSARAHLDARVNNGDLAGAVGGSTLTAQLKRDPPDPGVAKPRSPGSVAGNYQLAPSSACLGGKLTLKGPSSALTLFTAQKPRGRLIFRGGTLAGTISCNHGGQRRLNGTAAGRQLDLMLAAATAPASLSGGAAAGAAVTAASGPAGGSPATPAAEHLQATKQRTADETVVAFFVAVIVVMVFARLCGSLMPLVGQPRVMGEVLAGILLGPTVFGAVDPALQTSIFSSDIVPIIGVVANLGLIFYMFLIGLEVDIGLLRGRVGTTLAISNTGLAVPMMLGMLASLPLYRLIAPDKSFLAFALFAGVSMSITAFPVLARIISERRMLRRPLGALALSAAAVDDVSAWFLIALATAVAGAGTALGVGKTVALAIVFCLVMGFAVRPVLARAAVAYDEVGRLPGNWIAAIFAGVLLAAVTTDKIGIAVIFGAFVMGLSMPRHAGLSDDVTRRVEDFVLVVLLPLFFAYTGLRTNIGLLARPQLILITLALILVAILGKYGGTLIAARTMRMPWRESALLGALMNTRGLTELIVLNLALDRGVISSALFTALVIMALVTTLMAGPIVKWLDPHNRFGEPPEQELRAARQLSLDQSVAAPERSILVAPQTAEALDQLLTLAQPLARSEPRREIILARLVPPPRGAGVRGGLQTEARLLREASDQVQRARLDLLDQNIAARAVALTSANRGSDLVRLSRSEEVDLVLLDGRRPLLGEGIPREEVGDVLRDAPCDVAVLVAREEASVVPGAGGSVMVPFGGGEHDWAALELATWISAATGASLELLGAGVQASDGRDASRLLADASLLVQQMAGVTAAPVLAKPGRDGVVAAAAGASLLVVGLSDRWQKEGLGETRKAIARSAPAPILFVRRGERPGALAPRTDVTRFGWSRAGAESSFLSGPNRD